MAEDPIRPVRIDDIPALSDLAFRSKAHWGYDEAFMSACREELTVTPAGIARCPTFVYDDGSLCGFYQLSITGEEADIALFFVDPPMIGRGIGQALWRHMVGEARRVGVARIAIEADPDAEGFYLRMGAKRIGIALSMSIPDRELPLLLFTLD